MSASADLSAGLRILALNGASSATGAAFGLLATSGDIRQPVELRLLEQALAEGRGGADRLPILLAERLDRLGWAPASLGLVAVVIGPGSFTGLRASLALAYGLSLGMSPDLAPLPSGGDERLVGVTIGEAIGPALQAAAGPADELWCVSQARRDRVFIERPHGAGWSVVAAMLDALPRPQGPVLLGGDAAAIVSQRLADVGAMARCSELAAPSMTAIAAAALARIARDLPPRAAQPLYVDPPEAKLPGATGPGRAGG